MCDCEELEFEDFQLMLDSLSKPTARKDVPVETQVVTVPLARKAR